MAKLNEPSQNQMSQIQAKILEGVVINIQEVNPGDVLDPSFTWVNITGLSPAPGIGWTYDGVHFAAPAPVIPDVNWITVLQNDISYLQDAYFRVFNDYQAALEQGAQTDADSGITAGLSDISTSYTVNESSAFQALIQVIQTGG